MAKYAFHNKLTNTNGWKWSKRHLKFAERFSEILSRVCGIKAMAMRNRNEFKFGVQFSDNFKHAHLLHNKNVHTLKKDGIAKELSKINHYNVFKQVPKGSAPRPGKKRILYHIVFNVSFDSRRDSRLIPVRHRIDPLVESCFVLVW